MELLLFTSMVCPSCKPMKEKIRRIAQTRGVSHRILNIDDSEENYNLAMSYYISSTPTLIVMKDGVAMDTIIGNVPEEKILESL